MFDYMHKARAEPRGDVREWSAWILLGLAAVHTLGGVTLRFGALESSRSAAGDADANIYQYVLIALMLAALFVNSLYEKSARTNNMNALIVLTFVWCFASAVWSLSPSTSLRRSFLLFVTCYATFLGVARLGIEKAISCVLAVSFVVVILDYAFVALGIGVHTSSDLGGVLVGDWRGMHAHKNGAGAFDGALFVFLFLLLFRKLELRLIVLLGASALFLVFTDSKTAWVAAPVSATAAIGFWLVVRLMGVPFSVFLAASVVALTTIVLQNFDLTLQNDSFTGRGEIWIALISYIEQNPFLGSGFGAFWNIGFDSPIFGLSSSWVSLLTEGHNGYLDQAVAIGLPGLALAVVGFYLIPLVRLWPTLQAAAPNGRIWLGLIIFSAIQSMTESALLAPDGPAWFFLVFSIAAVETSRLNESAPTAARRSLVAGQQFSLRQNAQGGNAVPVGRG